MYRAELKTTKESGTDGPVSGSGKGLGSTRRIGVVQKAGWHRRVIEKGQ